jgi:hypothetical protein
MRTRNRACTTHPQTPQQQTQQPSQLQHPASQQQQQQQHKGRHKAAAVPPCCPLLWWMRWLRGHQLLLLASNLETSCAGAYSCCVLSG